MVGGCASPEFMPTGTISLMPIPVVRGEISSPARQMLDCKPQLLAEYLVEFLRQECVVQRGVNKAIIGLSGGVDSAVTTYLAALAFGAENTFVFRLPYKVSSSASLDHAQLVINDLGLPAETIDITPMVDGYGEIPSVEMTPYRLGNVCARSRMIVLYDQAARIGGLPLGTGNKTERMFGYYTWHGDDAPPINPLGDLFKTQVFELAEYLGVPAEIRLKPPTADLIEGQTDEGDFGITYALADEILVLMMSRYETDQMEALGYKAKDIEIVRKRVAGTHWKRKLPTVAMTSTTSINEYYLRPVDFRHLP